MSDLGNPFSIIIREARPRDRDSIFAFTQNTFRWGDYVPQTWDEWLRAADGKLIVAEVEGKTVGNLHVAFVGEREAWFEGMRVHPKFRKRGVAARLDTQGRAMARAAGCYIVRLETGADNHTAQAALGRFGYRRVLSLREWESPAVKGATNNVRPAHSGDLHNLVRIWEHSWVRRATRSLSPLGNPWHWGYFTRSRLCAAVARGCVWITPGKGRARGFAEVSEQDDAFEVMLVVGRAHEVGDLLTDFLALAGKRGEEKCYLIPPDAPRTAAWARANGFKAESGGMLIYEQLISKE